MNSTDGTMRAMRASSSDPASLSLDEVPIPDPGPGEVLVRVAATAVTAQELTWPEEWPVIPCHDLSGVVAGSGPGRTGHPDRTGVVGVVGFDRPGAAPQSVPAPPAHLAAKPAGVDHVAAAAIPLGGLTAWQALRDHADL